MRIPGGRLIRSMFWCVPGLMIMLALGALSFWILRDHAYFHVTTVRVYGAERVSQQEVMHLAQIRPGISLWRVDAHHIRARLLQHAWIKDIQVHRLFPSALELLVYERKPSAILAQQTGYIIDADGYVLSQLGPRESFGNLPRLLASDDQTWNPGQQVSDPGIRAGLRLLAEAQTQPSLYNAGITDIEIINPERFIVRTRRGKLVVGANLATIEEKLAFLPALDEVLRTKIQLIDAIDLSFANQIVVKTSTRTPQGIGRLQQRGGGSAQTD